jgi:hypothetical protein
LKIKDTQFRTVLYQKYFQVPLSMDLITPSGSIGRGNELQSVKGIGNSIAARIKWAVKEEIQSYGVFDEFPI